MAFEIIWSPGAKEDYYKTVSYLYDTWGDACAEKFTNDLQASLRNLEQHPFIGRQYNSIPSVRQLVLDKHQILYYTVFGNVIGILNVLDTRREI